MKPSPKELDVAARMRRNVISGKWAVGTKLPPYSKLERSFPVSRVTLHRAVTRLQREGFLCGFERKGVYVSQNPPHLKRIALLLATPESKNRFSSILAKDARAITKQGGFEIVILPHLDRPHYKVEEAEGLRNDLSLGKYAGMIVVFDPAGCPLPGIFEGKTPKIYMSPADRKDGFIIHLDNRTLAHRTLQWLKDRGARRIAVIAFGSQTKNPILQHAKGALADFGFESRPEWLLEMDNEELSDHVARLIFAAEKDRRPDGLLIADDNLTEPVTRGILASGTRVPEDLKVISHCNWSMPPKRLVPVELIGFDSKIIISESLRIIDACKKGDCVKSTISLPPVLENEYMAKMQNNKEWRK